MIEIEQYITPILDIVLDILGTWWWIFLPVIFYFIFKNLYLFWLNWEVFYGDISWTILEVIPPATIEKPYRAMEDIFNKLWGIYDGPNWRGYWCEGMFHMPAWFSIEVVSIGGMVHYYFRLPKGFQGMFETTIHTHYPDADIFPVDDYTQNIPQDIPNSKYDFYSEDYKYFRDWVYPIKTYPDFEAVNTQNLEGTQKIEPINSLMESLVKIQPGEQYWLQIIASPIINSENEIPWQDLCQAEANKIAKKPEEGKGPEFNSIGGEAFRAVAFGKVPFSDPVQEDKPGEFLPPEMKLTPIEKDKLMAVEGKLTKKGFKVGIRSLYFYERDKYFGPNKGITVSYFGHFTAENMNFIMFWAKTRPRVHYFFKKQREFQRKMQLLRKYIRRFPPMYPDLVEGTSVMNSEELATIFHFPTNADLLPSGVPRVASKKGEAPMEIPLEGSEPDDPMSLPIEDLPLGATESEPETERVEELQPSEEIVEELPIEKTESIPGESSIEPKEEPKLPIEPETKTVVPSEEIIEELPIEKIEPPEEKPQPIYREPIPETKEKVVEEETIDDDEIKKLEEQIKEEERKLEELQKENHE